MDNNFNIDNDTMNRIKGLVDNGNLSGALSQISPEMIENFSKMMKNNTSDTNTKSDSNNDVVNDNNVDMNTIMKMSSMLGNIGKSNDDPRANLLNSLKPYLRDNKKDKLDSYVNLLNMSKFADVLKNMNTDKK